MDLIIGGAYQGKLDYAKKTYDLTDDDIFICDGETEIDFSKRVIYHFENHLYKMMESESSSAPYAAEYDRFNFRDDAIVIMDDIFCGVVPTYGEARAWREYCGRTMTKLSERAASVTRIFCGLPLKLK